MSENMRNLWNDIDSAFKQNALNPQGPTPGGTDAVQPNASPSDSDNAPAQAAVAIPLPALAPAAAEGAEIGGSVLLGAGAAAAAGVAIGAVAIAGVALGVGHLISSAEEHADPIDDEGPNEGGVPQCPPDWQHGAPTKPVPPDPHVQPLEPDPTPPGQGPYRTPVPVVPGPSGDGSGTGGGGSGDGDGGAPQAPPSSSQPDNSDAGAGY